ncbi:CBN-MLTN-1 protein [Caenorhabditis brenneri]|uniref:CBN-MLTN-1 protein n=1 Tax=Caenorhabditis brenneri TaxID=135651 RepID=G0NMW1_CAEBE|nr:CBN-MLTN-1 protein [Caenorhabditis brenneri]
MSTESGEELLEHWSIQGFSGVIAAIATRRLTLVEKYHQAAHQKCASDAETISEHAKCLLQLEKDAHTNLLRKRRKYFNKNKRRKIRNEKIQFKRAKMKKKKRRRRMKREVPVRNRENYSLKAASDMSPLGVLAKHLSHTLRLIKNKRTTSRWEDTITRISEKAQKIKERKGLEKLFQKRMNVFQEASEDMKQSRILDHDAQELMDLEKYIGDDDLKSMVRKKAVNLTEHDRMMLIPMRLIRQAAKLGLTMTGQNTTDFDRKVVRIFSPKMMSVVPTSDDAKKDEIDILSPSLFSLHQDGSSIEKEVSLQNLLGSLTANKDTSDLLDFIIEATGVDEAMERVESKIEQSFQQDRGPEGQPLYFTKENVTEKYPHEAKKIEIFEALDKTYSEEQLKEMNRTGYTIMRHDQMELIYGNKSAMRNLEFLERAKQLSRSEIDRNIMGTINDLAREKVKFEARRNDIVLSPVTFTNFVFDPVSVSQPTILSPILIVSLIGSPAIYGVMILSPWLMVPVILSPRIFSPVVLNPFVMVPIILSPLAFNPFVLCPGILNPFVLSPLVFSPFILSPQVMTPLILSPFCMGPLVLNPLALNPLILSPFVLSPIILSPQFVSAVILSPYALSPSWKSDGAVVTVFASPSWLS